MTDTPDPKVISLNTGEPRKISRGIVLSGRRYDVNACQHKGPYLIDEELATIECEDCGSALNPLFVLGKLARLEGYWTTRMDNLREELSAVNIELADRTRTKCTHCGNMTAIKFKGQPPKTWPG